MLKILLSILGVCYALSPYDLVPDFFVGWGWLDDLIILGLLWRYVYSPVRKKYSYAKANQGYTQSSRRDTEEGFFWKNRASSADSRSRKDDHSKDPWSVLGIGRDASLEEIKRAYRQLAMKYHPDKMIHLGEEFRALAENRFKEIQQAYQELRPR
jgi:uncharacterized membrane protein YkvA (DUF1232 family)